MVMALPIYAQLSNLPMKLGDGTMRTRASARPIHMEQQTMRGQKLMEFPHLVASHRDVMVNLISAIDNRLASHLLPSSVTVPPSVEYYQNESGSSQGTLSINRGIESSSIDFVLASWLHLSMPNGGAMSITNIQGYLKPSTEAPHFQFELVQCSPTYYLFFLDLTPRRDVVLRPDYLKTFYEDNQLEAFRQRLEAQVPEARPFFSSSLYFRNVISCTGIMVSINCQDGGVERIEEIIRDHVGPIAEEVLGIWMGSCVLEMRNVGDDDERGELEKRDDMIKRKAVEMDLSSNMPKQFGQEVADRFLGVIREVFRM